MGRPRNTFTKYAGCAADPRARQASPLQDVGKGDCPSPVTRGRTELQGFLLRIVGQAERCEAWPETRLMQKTGAHLKTLALALVAAAATAGCARKVSSSGSFDKTLTVNGPVHLELGNVSGDLRVVAGSPGQVEVHGSFEARAWPWQHASSRLAGVASNPPIEQSQNLIRVGLRPLEGLSPQSLVANYSVVAPPDTEVFAHSGSGKIFVEGVRGPVELTTGNGAVSADEIGGDARARSGSGDIRLRDIAGEADVSAGAGDINLSNVAGEVRVRTGSGDITIENPRGAVNAKTGSGDIRIAGATDDVQAHGGMGDVTLQGNPRPASYWELHAGAGDITLRVPTNAGFRIHAHSGLGEIRSELPGLSAGHSAHQLRGQFGNGGARIEIETGLGDIRLELAASPAPAHH
jgi:hypothetical protein